MQEINIIIPNERLNDVKKILYSNKVGGFSFYNINGRGRAERQEVESITQGYRTGKKYVPEFTLRTKVEVIIRDSMAKQLVDDLIRNLNTGSDSDGKIFIKTISDAYDIGSKEIGDDAL